MFLLHLRYRGAIVSWEVLVAEVGIVIRLACLLHLETLGLSAILIFVMNRFVLLSVFLLRHFHHLWILHYVLSHWHLMLGL